MAIDLREDKIEKLGTKKKKRFFGGKKRKKQKKAPAQSASQKQKKSSTKTPTSAQQQYKPSQQYKQKKQQQSQQHETVSQNKKTEKWVRKEPKKPLPEEKLDYQRNVPYEKEYSRYLQEHKDDILVHWRGPDYEYYPRSKKWYMGASILIALVILYALWTDSIIMAILFVLIWIVAYLQLSRAPKVIDFAITYEGIVVGEEVFSFDDIKSFWIFYDPPHTRIISVHMRGRLRPYLHIPLHQVDPVKAHRAMVQFIPEERQEENIVDILERLLHL